MLEAADFCIAQEYQSVRQLAVNQLYGFENPLRHKGNFAGVAQLVEQLIRNQQ